MLKSFYNEKLCFPIGSANSETAPRLLYYACKQDDILVHTYIEGKDRTKLK